MPPLTRNVLIDECVDRRLAIHLKPHPVTTVPDAGWAGVKNGRLLQQAGRRFDVFVTVDRNLSFQQNVSDFGIAVVVLHAPSNRLDDLLPLVPRILRAIESAEPGKVQMVS